jgi:hypothetical protein
MNATIQKDKRRKRSSERERPGRPGVTPESEHAHYDVRASGYGREIIVTLDDIVFQELSKRSRIKSDH